MNPEVRSQKPESNRLAPAKSFEQLNVWQKSHQFVLGVYRFTDAFSRNEIYGLTAQLRRAAVSIPANLAEGFKKLGRADKVRFLNIAQGPLEECRCYLILAKDLHYGETVQLDSQLEEISKLLGSYSAKILASGF
ncbi:MAG: four helix bundle protein [Verrucomicrobiia bacterium]